MISVIQVLSMLFGLFMLYVLRLHGRKNYFEKSELYLWAFIWIGFIYVAVFPQTFKGLIQRLQIARVFDLLVIIAFMIITFLTFINRVSVNNLKKKFEEIVRKQSFYAKNKPTKN